MRKTIFVNALSSCAALFLGLALASISIPSFAQDKASGMPKNPNQLLLLVQKQNRLTNPGIQPWHLKISVKQFEAPGGAATESRIEEFWVSESKHTIIYTTATASMTDCTTETGRFRTIGPAVPPGPLMQAGVAFTNPIFENEDAIEKWILNRESRKENGLKLVCLSTKGIRTGWGKSEFIGSTYCLEPAQPSLLLRSNPVGPAGDAIYTRSNIQNFHGYYVPQLVVLTVNGERKLEAHLDLIEDLSQADDAIFSPPLNAVPAPLEETVNISADVSRAILVQGNAPEYPIAAKIAGIGGTVVLEAKIGKDGSVSDVKVVSGPKELQQAAIDAVKTWRYKPYILNGEPVAVRTTVNVGFNAGK